MNMADFLLGKADFTKSLRGEFDATSKEITLQRIAGFTREHNGVVSHNKLSRNLIEFFDKMGLIYNAADVIGSLCDSGILRRSDDDIQFKYRCFEEYFEARRIGSSDKSFKAAVYNREYLGSARQIELLSGITRRNELIIQKLLLELEMYPPDDVRDIDTSIFDGLVKEASDVGMTELKLQRMRKKKLTEDQIDDLVDAAEASLTNRKRKKETESTRPENDGVGDASRGLKVEPVNKSLRPIEFMMTLDLLGKVLMNSEFTPRDLKVRGGLALLDGSTRVFLRLNDLVQDALDDVIESMRKQTPILMKNQ